MPLLIGAYLLHLLVSIAHGRFGRARIVTWLAMLLSWNVVGVVVGFIGYVLPWGQISLWAASALTNALAPLPGGDALVAWLWGAGPAGPAHWWPDGAPVLGAVALALLIVDVLVLYLGLWRNRSARAVLGRVVLLAVAAGAAAIVAWAVVAPPAEPPDPSAMLTPAHILPVWWALPLYALLRCTPDKWLGVVLMLAALLAPALAPAMGAWRFNADWRRWLWWPLCGGLAAVWVALGVLGGRAPDAATIAWSQVLAAAFFAFFLLVPVLLRPLSRRA